MTTATKFDVNDNFILLTDSYKQTHHEMYPDDTEVVYSYFESRNGAKFPFTTFFGLQYLMKQHLVGSVITAEKIEEAREMCFDHFGTDKHFNRDGWYYILEKHDGFLPLEIRAVPEGMKIPINNIMMSVHNTDHEVPFLTGHTETLITHVWGPSVVATMSAAVKDLYKIYLEQTCDEGVNFPGLGFMLHDFGMRGTSSMESAAHLGAGHLINFLGTDTMNAMRLVNKMYNGPRACAYSVNATEHSVMTAKARSGEVETIRHIFKKFPTGILSMVSDSYDIENCVKNIYCKELKNEILARDGKLVVRPDSGEPTILVPKLLQYLYDGFGGTVNKKGYRVLHPKIGLIWGDGIDMNGIAAVLYEVKKAGFSVENLIFGMGGGLLQKINRDTQRSAFKSSAQMRSGEWYDIFKDPTDSSKKSKKGILYLEKNENEFITKESSSLVTPSTDILRPVFRNGELLIDMTFDEIRKNSLI